MIKTVVIDKDGKIINVGEWDYQIKQVEVGTRQVPSGTETIEIEPAEYDEEGNLVKEAVTEERTIFVEEPVYEEQITNPLPEGADIMEMEVVQDQDGGWVPADDYQRLRRAAYPPYNPFDIIDELLKHVTPEPGSKLEQIQQERLAVKQQYPKPTEGE